MSDARFGVEVGALVRHRRLGALERLVEQLDQLDRITASAAEHLAVVAEHAAERHVHRLGRRLQPAGHLRHLEHHLQVLGLRGADHVEQQIGVEMLGPVEHAGEVARGVHERAGARPHDQRERLVVAVREAGHEHDLGAVAVGEEARSIEPVVDLGHQRLVLALAGEVVVGEEHAELAVDDVEVVVRHVDEPPPDRHRPGLVRLKLDDPGAGAFPEFLRLGELGVGRLVEAVEIALSQTFGGDVLADVEEVFDQHPERAAPVADVVLADHRVTLELEHPHQRVADHRGAEVAGVHLLRNVRCGVVDDDLAVRADRMDADAIIRRDHIQLLRQESVVERQVDEARPGDLDAAAHAAEHTGVDHLLCDLAWVRPDLLGQRQGTVDLCVGTLGGPDHRIDVLVGTPGDLGEHGRQQVGDDRDRVGHADIVACGPGLATSASGDRPGSAGASPRGSR